MLLYPTLAALVVVLLGALIYLAFNGAKVAQARQVQRYRVLELKSQERAIHIRTDRHLWEAAQKQSKAEQKERHAARRRQIHDWQQEYSGY